LGSEPGRENRRANKAWPISAYLVALTLTTSLPIGAAAALLGYHFVSASSQRVRSEYEDRLRLMRSAVEMRIANVIEDLQVLSESPALKQHNLPEFRAHALASVKLIGGITLVVYDRTGQQVLNTRLAPEADLPQRREFEVEGRVFETRRPQVSGLLRAVVDGQPVVTIVVPVQIAGDIPYVLDLGLSPKYLASLMDQYVPDGMVGSIIDSKGILLSRRPLVDGSDLVGRPTIPEVLQHIAEPSAFWLKAVSREGVPTYSSLLRSDQTGWTISLAVPRATVDGPLRRTVELIVGLTVLTLALGLLLAQLVAKRFLRTLSGLEAYIRQLGHLQVTEPIPGPVAEVNRMREVLHRVGEDIQGSMTRQKILVDEINHRVKNTLATVQSVARLSRASAANIDDYASSLEQRLLALSSAYDLLTENNWEGASLREIVQRTLAPYAQPGRAEVVGPLVSLSPKAALAISAAVLELSTNAAKYGALAIPAGKLSLTWSMRDAHLVCLQWTEHNGPLVKVPTRRGFGTTMLQGLFGSEPGSGLAINYAPSGLRCTICFLAKEATSESMADID